MIDTDVLLLFIRNIISNSKVKIQEPEAKIKSSISLSLYQAYENLSSILSFYPPEKTWRTKIIETEIQPLSSTGKQIDKQRDLQTRRQTGPHALAK